MKFLFLNQFYPPDPAPTGRFLHDLATFLVRDGHSVSVITSQRSYDGDETYPASHEIEGVHIRRLPSAGFNRTSFMGKLLNYASFYRRLAACLLSRTSAGTDIPFSEFDLVLALTTPPYLGLLTAWAARRRGRRHAHWIMDLYPDVMEAHSRTRSGTPADSPSRKGPWIRLLERLTRRELADSALILTLGPDMVNRISRYLPKDADTTPKLAWVPLWGESGLSPWPSGKPVPIRNEQGWAPSDLVLLYSGNMGLGHRFTEFLDAASQTASIPTPSGGKIRWAFAGEGKRKAEIAAFSEKHPDLGIQILPSVSSSRLREHLSSADVHLVSFDSRWSGCMAPSKFQSIFAVGRPVILVGGPDSVLAQWIRGSGGGWYVPENDVEALILVIREATNEKERMRRGALARAYAELYFKPETNLRRIRDLLLCAAEQ